MITENMFQKYMQKRYEERLFELRRNSNLFNSDYGWSDVPSKYDLDISPLSLPVRHIVEKVIGGVLSKVRIATHASDGEMEGGQGA